MGKAIWVIIVAACSLPEDKESGANKGYAFVNFLRAELGISLIAHLAAYSCCYYSDGYYQYCYHSIVTITAIRILISIIARARRLAEECLAKALTMHTPSSRSPQSKCRLYHVPIWL